jgi:uncharacterized membrane protein YphA (DoxX/SURF4 family)
MNVLFVLGRIALVAIFVVSGAQKLMDIAGTADEIQSKLVIPPALTDLTSQIEATVGMPIWQILAIVVAVIELVGGLLIAFNILMRTMAVILLIFVAVAAFYTHDFWNFWNLPAGPDRINNMTQALKDLSAIGALLVVAAWPRRASVSEGPLNERGMHQRVEPL